MKAHIKYIVFTFVSGILIAFLILKSYDLCTIEGETGSFVNEEKNISDMVGLVKGKFKFSSYPDFKSDLRFIEWYECDDCLEDKLLKLTFRNCLIKCVGIYSHFSLNLRPYLQKGVIKFGLKA